MDISLIPEQAAFVDQLIASGEYLCAEEVVGDAVRLLQDLKELDRIRMERLRKEIALGIEQADRGELIDGEEVFRHLRSKLSPPADRAS
jgi:antitoxin ParD1/3/4